MPEHTLTFWERYSLERALSKLFEKEESNKILAFSLFKLFSLPFVALGFLFFLSNYGSYNYFSFDEEIYQTFYAKVATFAYYLPDIFFFISGYVFTSKLIQLDEIEDNK
jgi:cytochrome c oxidase assembly factor CtaG